MNENIVITSEKYDHIDGRNAYKSSIKRLTLGTPTLEENKNMEIALQIWKETENGELEINTELPIHQVFDLLIFLSSTMLHFRDAYRLPLLFDPENPLLESGLSTLF